MGTPPPSARRGTRVRLALEQMPIDVLMAGCSEEERERVGRLVRAAIGDRAAAEPWRVSLVKVGGQWSASLDGPGARLRGRTFTVPEAKLRDAILASLQGQAGEGPPAVPAAAPEPPGDTRRDSQECSRCRKPFAVVYELRQGEGLRRMPVACPHCWQMNYVEIGQWAASGHDYRAERL